MATTIDDLIAALQAQRKIYGGAAEVTVVVDGDPGHVGLAVAHGHIAKGAGVTGAAIVPGGLEHGLYLTARALGDVRAIKRGRLPQRLVRRAVMKRIGRGLFGN